MGNFNQKGVSSIVITVIVLIVLILVGFGGWLVYQGRQLEYLVETPEAIEEPTVEEAFFNLVTTKLEEIPEKRKIHYFMLSFDGQQYAYVAEEEGKHFVVHSGKEGKSYDEIMLEFEKPVFSFNSQRLVYKARTGEKWFIVIDGKEESLYDWVSAPLFSPNSEHLAYVVQEGEEEFIVLDGKEGTRYERIESYYSFFPDWPSFLFSPDSQKLVYVARKEGKRVLTINGEEVASYGWIGMPVFSPDGRQLAYGAVESRETFLVVNGIKQKAYDSNDLPWGEDGTHSLVFSPDSQRLAYITKEDFIFNGVSSELFVVVNGKEGEKYGWACCPTFSPDSQHLAYIARKQGECLIVFNEKEEERYPQPLVNGKGEPCAFWTLIFSPDSQHLAYRVTTILDDNRNKSFIVLNGEKRKSYDWVDHSVFSPDSRHLAYIAREGQWWEVGKFFVVLNKEEGKPYDNIWGLRFSSDGKSLAYMAQLGQKLWWVVDEVD